LTDLKAAVIMDIEGKIMEGKITHYRLIRLLDLEQFHKEVEVSIGEGYQPLGPGSVAFCQAGREENGSRQYDILHAQTMVRYN
jgi:hypothetical protein